MDMSNHYFEPVTPQYVDASAATAIILGVCVLVGEKGKDWDYLENQVQYQLMYSRRWWLLN